MTHRTDAGILSFIPIPIIWKVKIPIRQKILVGLLLCSGLFIITAAIIRCVLSIQNIRSIDTSGVWAIRETFVTIVAINAPVIKPMFGSSKSKDGTLPAFKLQHTGMNSERYEERMSESGSQVKMVTEVSDEEEVVDTRINVTTMVAVHSHELSKIQKDGGNVYGPAGGKAWGGT